MNLTTALLAAPLPGLVIYLLGVRMRRRIDDPTFTERFWRFRVRISKIVFFSMLALAALAWRWTPVTLPLFALCVWLASFPLRRNVFAEEWTLGEYLRSRVRVTFGVTLFWIVLLFEPALVATVGMNNFGWVIAVMLIWSYEYRALVMWGIEAGPIDDAELLARLHAIVAKSRAQAPEILAIGTSKAHFPNAFASPHPKHPRVLISRTLLRHLDGDEMAAIFAHEVAHLEQFTGKRARVAQWAMFLFVIVGALMANFGAMFGQVVWVTAIVIGYARRQRRYQVHEAQCDVRAVELCGDPEALIRALTKGNLLGRIPRRWDSSRERAYSHPSLARRIQAIRKTSGGAPEPVHDATIGALKFDADSVQWPDGRTLRYAELTAMHIRPTWRGLRLITRNLRGKSSSTPVADADAAALEACLDRADLHLAAR
jgi:Zn-dependent protease with chaperone function